MTPPWLAALRAACRARGLRTVGRELDLSPATLSLITRELYMASTDRVAARVQARLTQPPLPQAGEGRGEGARAPAAAANPPDWLDALRTLAARITQAQAAERVGISEATASQVLTGKYGAATTRIERRVRGELLGTSCACPVMGDVSTRVCQDVQERQPPIANPQHAQTWFACRGRGPFARAGQCPHFNAGGAKPPAAPAAPKESDS